ncbi:MAG: flagellar biosynthesis protein FlhB [Anaerolineae bacterium]|nr:flagellar biosynthesis protein FlhB [Phycisphaerae bacterium]
MAEDFGDKTEAPTPRRRTEAREQGNIARSPDIVAAALLIGVMYTLNATGGNLFRALRTLLTYLLSGAALSAGATDDAWHTCVMAAKAVGMALAPLLLVAMSVAILGNVLQVGLFFSTKRLQPNLAALNPFKGVSKLLGGGQGMGHLVLNIIKVTLIGLVAYSAIHARMIDILTSQKLGFMQSFGLGAAIVYAIAIRVGILLLILAIIDYAYQRFRVEKKLKMSKQEVKDEMRRMEGDPQIKQRRRQIAMQRVMQRIKKDVPAADVVVTNPTHFAIALKYDSGDMHAPRVIAKGADLLALRIREIAAAAGVPIVERAPLARALYKLVDVGQEIPEQFYSAVAEILAYVYELSGKLKRKSA